MKARTVLILLIVFVLSATSYIVWKKFFSPAVITVAPVAPKRIIEPAYDAEHPPAWIAPESSPPPAQAGQMAREIHEAMPQFSENLKRPVLLAKGQFRAVDTEDHDVSGWAKLFMLPDGNYLVRVETLWMQGSPPILEVALARNLRPVNASDMENSISLGLLKAAAGNMNYVLQSQGAAAARSLVLMSKDDKRIYATVPLVAP